LVYLDIVPLYFSKHTKENHKCQDTSSAQDSGVGLPGYEVQIPTSKRYLLYILFEPK